MKPTHREIALLLFLMGVTALIVLLAVKREHSQGRLHELPSTREENKGAVTRLQGDGNAMMLASTNSAEGADRSVMGEDDAATVDDPEFAEKVRRIRPPPTDAGGTTGTPWEVARTKDRHAAARPQDTNEIVQVLNQIAGQPWTENTAKRFQDTLLKWGAQDPAAAMDYALTIESRRTRLAMLNTLIGNWARSDANGACAWALTNLQDDAGAMASALRPIFNALAGQNRDDAMRSVWELPAGSGRTTALRAVVERAVRDGSPGEMAAVLTTITDPQESRFFAASLAQNWAIHDPLAAAEWAMSLGDPLVRNAALGSAVGSWTSDQPDRAAEWVTQLPAGALRNQQMNRLTQTWAGFDPVGVADWLIERQPPQSQLDPAIQGLVTTVMRSNPEGAMGWAGAISDARLRNATLQQVGKLWMRQNPQQASAYISSSADLPPDLRARLLQGQ